MNRVRPDLLAAYRRTIYTVGDVVLCIGRRSPAMDALLGRLGARTASLVTAWNPFSRKMPAGWNHRMQRALRERLRRKVCLAAQGIGRGWSEAHFFVIAAPGFIRRLARIFRQNAVVIVSTGRPSRLA